MSLETIARKRVLLSSFACSPLVGSEPGVGWHWAIELAQRHEVTVLTHAYYQADIEAALLQQPRPGLHFVYFRAPGSFGHPHAQLNSRLYYLYWQFTARRFVRRWLCSHPQDMIHHLTWGSYRLPGRLGGLGVPLVLGPVGGGEGAPWRLYRQFPWRERLFYLVRAASIALTRFEPFVRASMRQATLVLAKTHETRAALPAFAHGKTLLASEIGIAPPTGAVVARPLGPGLKLLFAGRLLGGKGLPYVLGAMTLLKARGANVSLKVAGDGRLMPWARAYVQREGLQAMVQLPGMLARADMAGCYDDSDVLVFPSWHDSSGNVVTEALARGLPVMCLDLGGPRYAVNARCAVIVSTAGLNEQGLAHALARQIEALALAPQRLAALSRAAREQALAMGWQAQVARTYEQIEQRLGWRPSSPSSLSSLSPSPLTTP